MKKMYLRDIIISLIKSVDMVNYLLKDHHKRVAIISYNLGREMNLSEEQMRRLVLSAALHDVGALYVKERDELIKIDTENASEHAVRGMLLLRQMDFFVPISNIILHHHRHWAKGLGATFDGDHIPIESFILHLADRIEILLDANQFYVHQIDEIAKQIMERKDTVFEPRCVQAFENLVINESFWLSISELSFDQLLKDVIGRSNEVEANMEVLEQVTKVFSNIVDYRTHFTATHSKGVGLVAAALGKYSGLDHDTCQRLKLAGYLHDIGKIGVPTELIEKESKLTSCEKKLMNSHAYFTNIILSNIEGMEDICKWASMHHEKRDGSGYPFHKSEKEFSREVDILILSDIFTALSENRPYREGCKIDEILGILEKEKSFVDAHIYGVLIEHLVELDEVRYIAQKNNMTAYTSTMQSVSDYLNHEEMDVNC